MNSPEHHEDLIKLLSASMRTESEDPIPPIPGSLLDEIGSLDPAAAPAKKESFFARLGQFLLRPQMAGLALVLVFGGLLIKSQFGDGTDTDTMRDGPTSPHVESARIALLNIEDELHSQLTVALDPSVFRVFTSEDELTDFLANDDAIRIVINGDNNTLRRYPAGSNEPSDEQDIPASPNEVLNILQTWHNAE